MGYIRDRKEELTGYQERAGLAPEIDLQCDFVMVYGTDDGMPARVQKYREAGYRVHLMTGCAWGEYQEYLSGGWDGREHWEEAQTDRAGNPVLHGKDVPYLVPSVVFADYLTSRLKRAVDSGVEAIHMEEPEFWDCSGYSVAFRREYRLYYHEEWKPPHISLDAHYKASRLKVYLYARTLGRVSAALKEYASVRYGRELGFYVPSHSLINYAQWKILSPEASLTQLPSVDGYIAQVWTGTSRVPNVYGGVVRERTFETAFLEYGVMQELVKGTGRRMWFLHDPVEDWPEYTWEDFRKNYLKTVTASFLHPQIHAYEICPWPDRVFNGIYPRRAALKGGVVPAADMDGAKPVPPEYATLLSGIFQLCGDMDQQKFSFDGVSFQTGILISDSVLYQRACPDDVLPPEREGQGLSGQLRAFSDRLREGQDVREESRAFLRQVENSEILMKEYVTGQTFPHFYGMALPLLKYGLPVRPVQLDHVRRFPGYLAEYEILILSYEYMKPEAPDINSALALWVRGGGTLLYPGDGSDPYHAVSGWWNTGNADYASPAEHLFEMLELPRKPADGIYPVGAGRIAVWNISPARISLSDRLADEYRSFVMEAMRAGGCFAEPANHLTLRRGPYVISAVMDESVSGEPRVFRGIFADMLENDFAIVTEKAVAPGDSAILFDFAQIAGEPVRVIGISARVISLECGEKGFSMELRAADRIRVYVRVRLPERVSALSMEEGQGLDITGTWEWDERTDTLLLTYQSRGRSVAVSGEFAQPATDIRFKK